MRDGRALTQEEGAKRKGSPCDLVACMDGHALAREASGRCADPLLMRDRMMLGEYLVSLRARPRVCQGG
jgi:hypothetical protein